MKTLTRAQVDAFEFDGYLFPFSALTPPEVAACRAGLDRLERYLGRPVPEADIRWRSHAGPDHHGAD